MEAIKERKNKRKMTGSEKQSERKREKEERERKKVYRQAGREGGKGPDLCQLSDPYVAPRCRKQAVDNSLHTSLPLVILMHNICMLSYATSYVIKKKRKVLILACCLGEMEEKTRLLHL